MRHADKRAASILLDDEWGLAGSGSDVWENHQSACEVFKRRMIVHLPISEA
jgi:hypothetical protein